MNASPWYPQDLQLEERPSVAVRIASRKSRGWEFGDFPHPFCWRLDLSPGRPWKAAFCDWSSEKAGAVHGAVAGDGRMWHGEVRWSDRENMRKSIKMDEDAASKHQIGCVRPETWEVENYMSHTHVGQSDAVNLGCAENQQRVKCRRVPAWKLGETAVCSTLYMIVRWHVHCFVLNQNSWLIYACFCKFIDSVIQPPQLELLAESRHVTAPGNTGGVSRWKLHGVPASESGDFYHLCIRRTIGSESAWFSCEYSHYIPYIPLCHIIWLVVWNMFYFSIYWECHHPNWRSHIFQRGRAQPSTSYRFKTFQNSDQISSNGFGEHDPSVSQLREGHFGCAPASEVPVISSMVCWKIHHLHPFTVDTFPVKQSKVIQNIWNPDYLLPWWWTLLGNWRVMLDYISMKSFLVDF